MLYVKIKKLTDDAIIPSYAHETDAGMDIYANEDIVIYPGTTVHIKTGLSMAIPNGYYGAIVPRSGISTYTPLVFPNAPGTIDAGYRGEVMVLVTNRIITPNDYTPKSIKLSEMLESKDYIFDKISGVNYVIKVCKGDRIGQIIFKQYEKVKFDVVTQLPSSDRGSEGFGSTGIK